MKSSELGQKMRDSFEATLPGDEAILRRYDVVRLARVAARGQPKRVGLRVGMGGLLAAAVVLFVWGLLADRPVVIEPSLERDLVARSERDQETVNLPPAPRVEQSETEGTVATPLPAPREAARAGASKAALAPVDAPQAAADASWSQVTEAMRRRDWAAAQQALGPLLASSNQETRDSARLVRVRLELGAAHSQEPEARLVSELEELAKSGSTSSIRASARRLHKSLTDSGTKHLAPDEELPRVEE